MKRTFKIFTFALLTLTSSVAFAQELGSQISLEAKASSAPIERSAPSSTTLHQGLEPQWSSNIRTRKAGSTNFVVGGQLKLTSNNGCSPNQANLVSTQFSVNVNSQRKVSIKFPNGLVATGKAAANGKSFTAQSKMSVYNDESGHTEDRSINITAGAISSKGYAPFRFVFGARDTENGLTCSVQYNGTLKVKKK